VTVAEQFATVDEYVDAQPEEVQKILRQIRQTIRAVVPEAEETFSYGMPTVKLDGRYLMYFAAWKHHIAIYPIPAADEAFERELAPYRAAKGTLRFPRSEPIPYDLIERVVAHLLDQRRERGT
jgi:uncharacterized protein YdhG (YjbR/CyaY superfamily)